VFCVMPMPLIPIALLVAEILLLIVTNPPPVNEVEPLELIAPLVVRAPLLLTLKLPPV
jgi:hypothetical protein